MQTHSRPITVLLVIIAALLAVNLFVNLSPQVGANPPRTALSGDDDDEAVLVGITLTEASGGFRHILRLWSDGVVEQRIARASSILTPMNWDVPRAQFTGWVEIVPLP